MAILRRNPTREWEELKHAALQARLPYDKDVLLNIAFYLDQHYVEWSADFNTIRTIPRSTKERRSPRPVANKILHFVLKQHAAVLKERPNPDVLPATDDPVDISLVGPALSYLKWLCEPQVADFDAELSDATLWALAGGEAWLKWTYNAHLQRPDIMACSPLELAIDPYARTTRDIRYVIHEKFMDRKEVKHLYGIDVQPTTISKADLQKATLLRDMGMAPVIEGAVVNELWFKPDCDSRFPEGLFVAWSGKDVLVEPRPYPYAHKQLPFTHIGPIRRPGSPHTTCTVKYLRSPQMELNKYHAQKIKTREGFASPKWWIPEELELEQMPDDSPNQVLSGNSSGGQYKPEIIPGADFRDNGDGDWIRAEMMDVAGQHEISSGQVPGRVEAAQAIEALLTADDSHLFELQRTIKTAISDGFWQCLMLAKQFKQGETMVQTYSREGLPEVTRFFTEKLKPGMRIKVTMGSGLTGSRAAKQQMIEQMIQMGLIQDPEVAADLLDLPVGRITPNRVFDVRLARNENMQMAAERGIDGQPGQAIKPNSWDEHDIHIREHNNFRKTTEYAQADPEIKKKFEFHVQMHEELWLEEIQKQVTRQQMMQGAVSPSQQQGSATDGQPTDGTEPQTDPTVVQ